MTTWFYGFDVLEYYCTVFLIVIKLSNVYMTLALFISSL